MDLLTSKKSNIFNAAKDLGECEAQSTISIYGEYVVEILNSDNSVKSQPFGSAPIKSTILDSFIRYIISNRSFDMAGNGNVSRVLTTDLHSAILSCSVGNDNSPEKRNNKRSEASFGGGNALKTTYVSQSYSASRSGAVMTMTRNFLFQQETVGATYSEGWVASGYSSGNGLGTSRVFDVSNNIQFGTSRFVFPSQISLLATEKLRITFSLKITTPNIINDGMSITATNALFDFSGVIGYGGQSSGNGDGVVFTNGASMVFRDQTGILGGTGVVTGAQFDYVNNTWTTNTPRQVASLVVPNIDAAGIGTNTAGITTQAIGNFTFYPTNPGSAPAITGPEMYNKIAYMLGNFLYDDQGGSSDLLYYFPPHTASRAATGIILNHKDTANTRNYSFIRFNSTQTIPAYVPVSLKMRFRINRD